MRRPLHLRVYNAVTMLNPLLSAAERALFRRSYEDARQQFVELVRQAPAAHLHESHRSAGSGPGRVPLYTDLVWLGPDDASRVLVLVSATHGVEGFAGSAVQADVLTRLHEGATLPPDVAVLLIHGLNPWGMAWLCRCDHEGIDINRNFIDFTQPVPRNPGYQELRPALMQKDPAIRRQALDAFLARHGRVAFDTVVSGGQFDDPLGPFFGGRRPSQARRLIEGVISRFALGQRQLAVIDIHTGLGPYGYGELICDHPPHSPGMRTARQWFGDTVTAPLEGTSSSVPKNGLHDYAWHAVMDDHSCFVTLEFGTYDTDELFERIVADHVLHASGPVNWRDKHVQVAKQRMLRHFYPDDDQWRELVLLRARQVIRLALRGLTGGRHA